MIKLMWDYDCSPLWWAGPKIGNIEPEELNLSHSLCKRLWDWAKWAETNPKSLNERIEFLREQEALKRELEKELPYTIIIT